MLTYNPLTTITDSALIHTVLRANNEKSKIKLVNGILFRENKPFKITDYVTNFNLLHGTSISVEVFLDTLIQIARSNS
jgi:hypothetical protein